MNWININDSLPQFNEKYTMLSGYYSEDLLITDGIEWTRAQACFTNDKKFKGWACGVTASNKPIQVTHWSHVITPVPSTPQKAKIIKQVINQFLEERRGKDSTSDDRLYYGYINNGDYYCRGVDIEDLSERIAETL